MKNEEIVYRVTQMGISCALIKHLDYEEAQTYMSRWVKEAYPNLPKEEIDDVVEAAQLAISFWEAGRYEAVHQSSALWESYNKAANVSKETIQRVLEIIIQRAKKGGLDEVRFQ